MEETRKARDFASVMIMKFAGHKRTSAEKDVRTQKEYRCQPKWCRIIGFGLGTIFPTYADCGNEESGPSDMESFELSNFHSHCRILARAILFACLLVIGGKLPPLMFPSVSSPISPLYVHTDG